MELDAGEDTGELAALGHAAGEHGLACGWRGEARGDAETRGDARGEADAGEKPAAAADAAAAAAALSGAALIDGPPFLIASWAAAVCTLAALSD